MFDNLSSRALGTAALVGLLGLSAPAFAQDGFSLDTVLVATFEAAQPFLVAEADRVEGLVVDTLSAEYITVRTSEVPPFETYDAPTYVRACPKGQYIGCVFVVAGKAQTEWAIGGTVGAVEGGYRVTVQVVDVAQALLVAEFDTEMDGDDDEAFQAGVQRIMGAVLSGEIGQLRDEAAEKAAQEQAARDAEARRLAEQARQVAAAERAVEPVQRAPEAGRAEFFDERAEISRDGLEPWERAGLTPMQYRRYEATGEKLTTFKDRLRGRQGQILFRLSGQVGAGPWGTRYQAAYQVDYRVQDINAPTAAEITDERLVQTVLSELGLSYGGQAELGVGILPWLEIGVFGGVRYAPFNIQQTRYIWEQEPVNGEQDLGSLGWQVGGRVGVVPFPAFPVRPSLHVGASYWQGSNVYELTGLPDGLDSTEFIQPPNAILLHVQPGVEFSIGRNVSLWSRFDLDVGLAGRRNQRGRFQKPVQTEFKPGDADYNERFVLDAAVDAALAGVEASSAPALGGSLGVLFHIPTRRR